jgi:hypothetical protein
MTANASPPYAPPPGPPPYDDPAPERRSPLDLLDPRFERRLGPKLVRRLYLSRLAMVAAGDRVRVADDWVAGELGGLGLRMGIPIGSAVGLVWALGVRLVCEQLIRWTGPETTSGRCHATVPPNG